MSVRMLSREEIGLISSYIDQDILRSTLSSVYDWQAENEGMATHQDLIRNRRAFAMWLARINAIAVNLRYGVMLPAPFETVFYNNATKKRNADEYFRALNSMIYQLEETDDVIGGLFKRAVMEQIRRLGENE